MIDPPHRYRPEQRLRHRRQFDAVFDAHCRKNVGPLAVRGRPNDLPHNRLGLIVPRRVGNAVVRNRVKRLLRESFRLLQHELPAGYDVVVQVHPHPPGTLGDYQRWLARAVRDLDDEWRRRRG
ncbi:MAG: ribonuclease P protein component [Phycisphaeraceae bacterium]